MDKQKQNLQIYCANTVVESKLSKNAKLSLLEFIQNEADEYQLMALILDGRVCKPDEQTKQILKDRFVISNHNKQLMEAGVTGNILAIISGGFPAWDGYRAIVAAFDKCAESCGILKISNDRVLCLAKCRLIKAEKEMAALKHAKNACKTSECREKAGGKIDKLLIQLKKRQLAVKKEEAKKAKRMQKRGM